MVELRVQYILIECCRLECITAVMMSFIQLGSLGETVSSCWWPQSFYSLHSAYVRKIALCMYFTKIENFLHQTACV